MASNIPITNGQGQSSVAAEEIGTLKYQKIKVVGGETGSTSVMGVNPDRSINVSVIGAVTITGSIVSVGNGSVSGAINVSGSVLLGSSNASVITVAQNSSTIAIVTGSVVAIPIGNQSVSGTIDASILGWVPIQPSNTSIITRWADSSVIARVTGSVVTIPSGNQSISGAINISGSVLLGSSNASIISYLQSSSIIAINAGSVIAVPTGSTIAILQAPSIVGTYAEDAAHATADKGIFVLQVRNDLMSSVTSADGDYSPIAGGPIGETITANSPITKWVQGTADLRGAATLGASAIAIATGGSSVFTYITGVQVANMGSASVLVTFASGGSILGYTIAPAGGGSNIYYPNALKTPANFGFAASISGIASVLVSAQGFVAKV